MNKEKVRELACRLFDTEEYSRHRFQKICEQWLEQNQPEPVVVGLCDEQIELLAIKIVTSSVNKSLKEVIEEFLKTQTFARHNNEGKVYAQDGSVTDYQASYEWVAGSFVSLEEEYSKVKKELEQLKSQTKPSWESAPEWANWLAQDKRGLWVWHETEPFLTASCTWINNGKQENALSVDTWQQTLEQRPRPKVEVGQVWEHKRNGTSYVLRSIGKVKIEENWVACVTYASHEEGIYTRTLEDFLEKFVRVQS